MPDSLRDRYNELQAALAEERKKSDFLAQRVRDLEKEIDELKTAMRRNPSKLKEPACLPEEGQADESKK